MRLRSALRLGIALSGAQNKKTWAFCRMDYQIATPGMVQAARTAAIYKDVKFSDHAPLTIGYDFTL